MNPEKALILKEIRTEVNRRLATALVTVSWFDLLFFSEGWHTDFIGVGVPPVKKDVYGWEEEKEL